MGELCNFVLLPVAPFWLRAQGSGLFLGPMDIFPLPETTLRWLDSWGPEVSAQLGKALAKNGLPTLRMPRKLLVGTDCSGLEAPIYALRGLGLKHTHLWSSEPWPAARRVIETNSMPQHVLMHSVLDKEPVPYVNLYISGFSCKPFSMLHHKTKLLEEPEAKIFFGVVDRISTVLPACFVLENVTGIVRVKEEVMNKLQGLGYIVVPLLMTPVHIGIPVSRPRIYFLGVRRDVARAGEEELHVLAKHTWESMRKESFPKLADILLPPDHKLVGDSVATCKSRPSDFGPRAAGSMVRQSCKWKKLHSEFEKQIPAHTSWQLDVVPSQADYIGLNLPRERDAWNMLCARYPSCIDLAADLSQNIHRNSVRTDGTLPTLTPGGAVALKSAGRTILPIEKLLLHGLPIHTMNLPEDLSSSDWSKLGGNTMSVQVVACATVLAMAMVDWSLPACYAQPVAPTCHPAGASAGQKACQHPCGNRTCKDDASSFDCKLRKFAARFELPGVATKGKRRGQTHGKRQHVRKSIAKAGHDTSTLSLLARRWMQ